MAKMLRITPEEIQRKVKKARMDAEKKLEKQKKETDRLQQKIDKEKSQYPPTILTLAKRVKRMDPWNTVVRMDTYDACMVVYYKLKQRGIDSDDLRIAINNKHAWVEFRFADRWYIIDVKAILNPEYGTPIKEKSSADYNFYKLLTRFYTIDEFYKNYSHKIEFTKDEAKVLAMEDEGLNSAIKVIYH